MENEISMFKSHLDRGDFYNELLSVSYEETQEGYNLLAENINQRIDSHLNVEIQLHNRIEVILSHVGLVRRFCCVSIRRSNKVYEISQIVDLLIVFASGIGYDC